VQSILTVDSIGELIAFGVWALAVFGLRWAVFDSFPAAELRMRISRREAPRIAQISQVRWELQHRTIWAPGVDDKNYRQQGERMTEEQMAERRAAYDKLIRGSLAIRSLSYWLGCSGCQTFACALLLLAVTGWPGILPGACTGLAYSFLAVSGGGGAAGILKPAGGGCGSKK
jgi:hypothetical protein